MEYEPDPRHAELIVKSLNLDRAKGVTTPSVKKRMEEGVGDVSAVWTQTRQSQDRPDLAFSVKELAMDVQNPEQTSTANDVRLDVYGDSVLSAQNRSRSEQ